jgi:photosystem II stability/assembly factor-like uncharacterized protein
LQTTRLTGLSFSPDYFDDGVIYAGASRRLLRSDDHGESWQRIDLEKRGFGTQVVNKLDSMGVPVGWLRSSNSGSRPIYPTMLVQMPETGSSRAVIGTRFHGVLEYDHETGNATALWSGTDNIMNTLKMSPDVDQDGTLYASVRGEGVIRSDDGGKTWTRINEGLRFVDRWSSSEESTDFRRDVHLAISPGFGADKTLFAGSPAADGMYVSQDRGDSWRRLSIASAASPSLVLAVAVSPGFEVDKTLMVSIKGQGLYRSNDSGENFDAVGLSLIADNASIEWLEFSPDFVNDRTVVAASDEGLYLSQDGGASWEEAQRPVRYEDMRDVVKFDGQWQRQRGEQYSALTETLLREPGSSSKVNFVGDGVRWLGSTGPEFGQAEVFVDDQLVEVVSSRSEKPQHMQELFSTRGLGPGSHKLEIRVVDGLAEAEAGAVAIDAIDVIP